MNETLSIVGIGHAGDGIAETPAGRVFVPFALTGETVRVERVDDRGTVTEILVASDSRVIPPCPHFGICGGCVLQHLAAPDYLAWKRDEVVAAFAQRGIDAPVSDTIPSAPGTRRRAVLTAERNGRTVTLGFNRMASHEVIAIPECKVLVPAILDHLPAIEAVVAPFVQAGRRVQVTVIATQNGLDIAIENTGRIDPAVLRGLGARVSDGTFARITIAGETVFRTREPRLAAGPAELTPPPGGFVQAVAGAEEAMAEAILRGVGKAKTIADLFAGIGTFTFRLARQAVVTAAESEPGLVAALLLTAKRTKGIKTVTASRRDLFREPFSVNEIRAFDAVVFDPPRAGAKAQAEQLAASRVPRVVAVSCNPATLARDARILIDGGYRLTSVQPIDQFLWSAHIEAVATFER